MKKVFVSGIFNVFHPGHVRLLRFAKNFGDKLIVGVLSDKEAGVGAFVPAELRMENLKNNSLVDEVKIVNVPIKQFLKNIKPEVIVKGKEHETKYNEEEEVLSKYGGKLLFSSGEITFSSSDLLKREVQDLKIATIAFPNSYIRRRNIVIKKVIKDLEKFNKINVCVIGDLIVDKYIECEPLGMSREDSSVVIKPMEKNYYLGGAGIVSAHCSSLGAKTFFISVSGKDANAKFALKKLKSYGVHSKIFQDDTRPTTLKERYINSNTTVFRVSHVQQRSISLKIQKEIIKYFMSIVKKIDALILSDFNYGLLPDTIVKKIIKISKKNKIFIAADCQSSSQIGDIAKYKNIDLITPTENEARISLKNYLDGIIIVTEKLRKDCRAKNIILKLGENGILIHKHKARSKISFETDRINSLNTNPVSISGAGDCLLAITTLALATKSSIWESAFLGSLAAAVQVSRVGNLPVKSKVIKRELEESPNGKQSN